MFKFLFLVTISAVGAFGASTASSDSSNIVRPCKLNDYVCIRDNVAANSGCNRNVLGSIPTEYRRYNVEFETPFFNASYVDQHLTIRNHNLCHPSEFFYNLETDTLVFSVDCPNLDLESNRTLIQHRSLLEDTTYSYNIRGEYPLIRLTTTFPHADALDLCTAFTFADVTALPIFKINPNNKPTADFLSRDLTVLNIYERETFFYRGPSLFRYFVNAYICDFGCNE